MKKLVFLLIICLIACLSPKAQTWTHVNGRYYYDFLRVDSLLYLPKGPTSTRPAPISGAYWIRFNTDSTIFEFSNGSKWLPFAIKTPNDYSDNYVGDGTKSHDTSVVLSCGTQSTTYLHYNLPQFVGFRLRVFFAGQSIPEGPGSACLFGIGYFAWNQQTGDLFMMGFTDTPGYGVLFTMEPY